MQWVWISLLCAIFLVGIALLLAWALPSKGKPATEHWNSQMEFPKEYAFTIEKKPNQDFTILAISDTQLSDTVDVFAPGDPLQEITKLIADKKPDLIVLMGDITWTGFTKLSFRKFVRFIDHFQIPWATIFGNHEDENTQGFYGNVDLNWCADQILKSKYALFKKGPNNIGGVGNYVINITENGKITESLIFMDTHSQRIYPELNNEKDYDYIYDSQIDWYQWVLKGIQAQNHGQMPESMLYIHIPLCEYQDAYAAWEASGFDSALGFGNRHEQECPGRINSGMFQVIQDLKSTKYVFAGHDHSNNYSVQYKGVQLTYCTKTGYRTSYVKGQTGGTYITLGDSVNIQHVYIPYDTNKP